MGLRSQAGQASVELVAGAGAVVVAAVIVFQLLVAGYCSSLADGAAEAGALAAAAGRPVEPAVLAALPAWAADGVELHRDLGRIEVGLEVPSPLAALGARLPVTSSAWARSPAAAAGPTP
jgi:hypothetical protein